ncbi:MAG: antitoxin MazE family protein [Rhodanobacteraceae bacterium]
MQPMEVTVPSSHKSTGKVARHRERMRAAGLRPVQFWVPDTRSPEFAAQVRQQCQNLKNDPAEADVLDFTEEAAAHVEGWA